MHVKTQIYCILRRRQCYDDLFADLDFPKCEEARMQYKGVADKGFDDSRGTKLPTIVYGGSPFVRPPRLCTLKWRLCQIFIDHIVEKQRLCYGPQRQESGGKNLNYFNKKVMYDCSDEQRNKKKRSDCDRDLIEIAVSRPSKPAINK